MGKNNNKDFIMGSLIGGLIGAAAAMFLAPKSGKEIRDNLGQQANMVKDRTGRFTSGTLEKSSGLANAAREKTASLSQVVSGQSSQIMNKVRDITGASKGQTEFIEKEVADAMEQISEGASTPKAEGQPVGQSDGPGQSEVGISASIAEAVEAIEKDEIKGQPQLEAQVGSEDKVNTNS
jgi:gas vesicle protein